MVLHLPGIKIPSTAHATQHAEPLQKKGPQSQEIPNVQSQANPIRKIITILSSQLPKLPALHPGYLRLLLRISHQGIVSVAVPCQIPGHVAVRVTSTGSEVQSKFCKFLKTKPPPPKKKAHLNISWRCGILWCMCCISGVPRLLVQLLHQITGVLLLQALGQSYS